MSRAENGFFERERFEFRADDLEPTAEFELPFVNRTGKPLKILAVETSCSCMKVAVPQTELEPGAEGKVHCIFTVPNATGTIVKPVIVTTDAAEHPKQLVQVSVEVPSLLKVTPERLNWELGGAAEEKTLQLNVADQKSMVRLTKVECSRDLFEWSLKTIEEGRRYELRVKPKNAEAMRQPALGMFLIHTDSSVARQQKLSVYAVIEAVRQPPAK